MHKLLLTLFIYIFVVLAFPQSEALAVSACYNCPVAVGGGLTGGNRCAVPDPAAPGGARIVPASLGCPAGQTESTPGDPGNATCTCGPAGAAGAPGAGGGAPAAAVCTAGNCTSGGGQRCNFGNRGAPDPNGDGISTAIGCVPTKPQAFVEGLLKYGTVAAGAIAFILMLLGALGLITAEGNPESIKKSQETFYSAIIGLLFIIFAVLLMQLIGVDILGLPDFGPTK